MTEPQGPDPRSRAASVLFELHRSRRTTRQIWDGPRAGAETALVLGALRRRGTLDAVLKAYSTRKLALIKPETLASLRVALFEMLFLDDSPPHAVIHAAVDNVKRFGRFKDQGFANAVLRSVMRGRRSVPAREATDPRRSLPRDGRAIVFRRVVFRDPQAKPAEFLAARGSTALWIARRRLAELGFPRALACLDLQAATPPTIIRPAPEHMDDVKGALAAAGIAWQAGPHAAVLQLRAGVRASDVLEACGAWIVFQDAVASRVAPFLGPSPAARVLDYCAAPGGKATHLAQLVGSEGHVTAWDKNPERLVLVGENAERLGLAQLHCESPSGAYDAVLADVPCSNTGVLARRPEARWRIKERHLPGLAERQLRILKDAASHVRPGGALVYSTCSLETEENQGVVDAFLAGHAGFRLEDARTFFPQEAAGDGGFMARLRLEGRGWRAACEGEV